MATLPLILRKHIVLSGVTLGILSSFGCGATSAAPATPASAAQQTVKHPLYPPGVAEETLLKLTAPYLKMDEKALLDLVPPQGGFFYGDCPNCDQGAQERQIEWTPEMGDKVQCKYCKQIYPSEKYPENGQVEVKTPTGKTQVFKYYEDKDGHKYWMEARRWYEQREYTEQAAYDLARLYHVDPVKYAEAGQRSAAILKRFADVYPDFIARFDYPFRPKQFFTDGFPKNVTPYRASKWYWWGYGDISRILLLTYDILRDTTLLTDADRRHIRNDLFEAQLNWVANNDGTPLTNMHPSLWSTMAVASRVLEDNIPAEKVHKQMQQLITEQFSFDGMWQEGSPAYHRQTAQGLLGVVRQFHPELSPQEADELGKKEFPEVQRAIDAVNGLLLPDGRYTALKDAWPSDKISTPLPASRPVLLDGLGYAILGTASGANQMQAHLNYTGRFGHHHFDSLSLLLFGKGAEQYSDIGYTHSRARPWSLATAAHNTVVIDQKSQTAGTKPINAKGNLQLFSTADPNFQVVEAAAPDAYPGLATTYRRALIAVNAPDGAQYVVDVFDVAGGQQHDWFLHGSADTEQNLALAGGGKTLVLQHVDSLLPAGMQWKEPKNEGDSGLAAQDAWAYGVLRDPQQATVDGTVVATFQDKDKPTHGARTWILGAPGSRYITTKAWAVRNIGLHNFEDDAKLDQRMRQALIVRRTGATDRFVAVHNAFEGEATVQNVTMLPFEPDGVALKIERTGGTDYVLYAPDARERHTKDGALTIAFDGRAAIAHLGGAAPLLKMIGGTRFSFGERQLEAKSGQVTLPLHAVQGNRFTVEGDLPLASGEVFLVRHGDGRTTAFRAAGVEKVDGTTVISTEEPEVLRGAVNGPLTMLQFPQSVFPAPHQIVVTAHATTK